MASVGFLIWILYNAPLFQKVMVVWWIPLTTIASAIIIVHFVINSDKWGASIVGLGVFVFLGDLTYTLYLVHWPVYLAIQPNWTHWALLADRAGPAGHHLRHRHRQLVPHREAPHAMAAAVGGQGHRPHDRRTVIQPGGGRNSPSRPMSTAMSPTRPR